MSFLKTIQLGKIQKSHAINSVKINENLSIPYGDPKNNTTFGIIGTAGGGKTVSLIATADQYPNAVCFDPKGGCLEAINFISGLQVDKTGKPRWSIYRISTKKDQYEKYLEVNASELTEEILDVLCFKRTTHRDKISAALHAFLNVPKKNRTYELLWTCFQEAKLLIVMDDLDPILSKNDSGMALEDVVSGRKLIDIVGMSTENRCIAVLVSLIISYKRGLKELENKTGRHYLEPMFISCDDCQHYTPLQSALGYAFKICFGQGRQFLISSCLAGTNRGKLSPEIKGNMSNLFIFASKTELNSFWQKEHIDVNPDKLKELDQMYGPKGNFYMDCQEDPNSSCYAHYDVSYYRQLRERGHKSVIVRSSVGTNLSRFLCIRAQ